MNQDRWASKNPIWIALCRTLKLVMVTAEEHVFHILKWTSHWLPKAPPWTPCSHCITSQKWARLCLQGWSSCDRSAEPPRPYTALTSVLFSRAEESFRSGGYCCSRGDLMHLIKSKQIPDASFLYLFKVRAVRSFIPWHSATEALTPRMWQRSFKHVSRSPSRVRNDRSADCATCRKLLNSDCLIKFQQDLNANIVEKGSEKMCQIYEEISNIEIQTFTARFSQPQFEACDWKLPSSIVLSWNQSKKLHPKKGGCMQDQETVHPEMGNDLTQARMQPPLSLTDKASVIKHYKTGAAGTCAVLSFHPFHKNNERWRIFIMMSRFMFKILSRSLRTKHTLKEKEFIWLNISFMNPFQQRYEF